MRRASRSASVSPRRSAVITKPFVTPATVSRSPRPRKAAWTASRAVCSVCAINAEFSQLKTEIDRVSTQTKFNTKSLLDGSFTAADFQVGPNSGEIITVSAITNLGATALGITAAVDVTTAANASSALSTIDTALNTVTTARANLGASINRFEQTISNLRVTVESLQTSRSRVQDADFAAETASLTRLQILQQSGTAVLAQANAIPQNVLSLLR